MYHGNPYYAVGSFFSAVFGGLHWILLAVILVLGIYAVILLIQVMRKASKALDIWLGHNRPASRPGRKQGPGGGYPYQRWDVNGQGQAYQPGPGGPAPFGQWDGPPQGPSPGSEWNSMPQGQAYQPDPQPPEEPGTPEQ